MIKRVIKFSLIGLLAYVLFLLLRFPASAVVSRVDTRPAVLSGISGSVFNGEVDTITMPNNALPTGPEQFLIENVGWRFSPTKLFSGAGGASISFDAYNGHGEGQVAQTFSGASQVSDFRYVTDADGINVLLDPLAEVAGQLAIDVADLTLRNQLLESFTGMIEWRGTQILRPVPARLGTVEISIEPDEAESHVATVAASGGELTISGTVRVALNGDFSTDLLIQPDPSASRELTDMLRAMARPSSDGSFRVRRNGNFKRMM